MPSADAIRDFRLTRVPAGFRDDPYPWYTALREHDPVHALEGGGVPGLIPDGPFFTHLANRRFPAASTATRTATS